MLIRGFFDLNLTAPWWPILMFKNTENVGQNNLKKQEVNMFLTHKITAS